MAKKRIPPIDPDGTTQANPATPAAIINAPARTMSTLRCLGTMATRIDSMDQETDLLAMVSPVVTGEKSWSEASSSVS